METQKKQSGWPKNLYALTFDIDWAPDWCIRLCIDLCRQHCVPATFFITHETPLLAELRADPLFELGIHPNFLHGSSHGETNRAVLAHCLGIVPEARAMRTHGLVQSSHLYALVADCFSHIETDVSLLLPFHQGLCPTDFYWGASGRRIVRIPYCWEDDVAAAWPGWDWNGRLPHRSGLAVLDFHPVYVALNVETMDGYKALKSVLGGRRLFETTPDDFAKHVNHGPGARTYLEFLLSTIPRACWRIISDIANEWRASA